MSPARDTWNVDTLREHFEGVMRERDERYAQRFEAMAAVMTAQQRELQAQLSALERQIQRGEEMTERRFDGVNTARRIGDDVARQMMPRLEAVQRDAALDEKIAAITARIDRSEGRSRGLHSGWAALVGGIGLLASVATTIYAITRITAGP